MNRWIRTWHYSLMNAKLAKAWGAPVTGDFAGVTDFDEITSMYPSRHDKAHLNITLRGKTNDHHAWLTVLKADVVALDPTLVGVFPDA